MPFENLDCKLHNFQKKAIEINDEKSRNIGEILTGREDSCSPRNRCKNFLSFLLLLTARCKRRTNERVVRWRFPSSRIHYLHGSERYVPLFDLDSGRGRRATAGTKSDRVDNTIYLSRAFYGNSFGRSSRYNDRWYRYDRDRGTCVLRLSATFFDSHAEASRRQ